MAEVAVVGLGLIGGSLSLALRRLGIRVRGIDRNSQVLAQARRRGAVSWATTALAEGSRGAKVIFLCVPVHEMARCARELAAVVNEETVITDTGSVKIPVMKIMKHLLPYPHQFIGGHPMAGSEHSGIGAANARLFRGRCCVLTPIPWASPAAVRQVARLWRRCGAKVIKLTPKRHDALAARISHLPHALAVVLMRAVLKDPAAAKLVAGSFLNATRVASSSPKLWEGIFMANRAALLASMAEFSTGLGELRRLLRAADTKRLRRLLRRAEIHRSRLDEGREGSRC